MSVNAALHWFYAQFGDVINEKVEGTGLTTPLVMAVGFQETGYIWDRLRTSLPVADVLRLCVGDTFDRNAFPKTAATLRAFVPDGE